jgi:hypothetical protein
LKLEKLNLLLILIQRRLTNCMEKHKWH